VLPILARGPLPRRAGRAGAKPASVRTRLGGEFDAIALDDRVESTKSAERRIVRAGRAAPEVGTIELPAGLAYNVDPVGTLGLRR